MEYRFLGYLLTTLCLLLFTLWRIKGLEERVDKIVEHHNSLCDELEKVIDTRNNDIKTIIEHHNKNVEDIQRIGEKVDELSAKATRESR